MSAKTSKEIEQRVVELYTTPAPDGAWIGCNTIEKIVGISTPTVFNILRRNGIPIRGYRASHANGKRCKPIKNLPPADQPAPLCKCGCGNLVAWNQRKNRWNLFVDGHYRGDKPYKHEDWLRHEYEVKHRAIHEIASSCGVGKGAVKKFMEKFGIISRTTSETLLLNGSVGGSNNPAWKGGIANWKYAPGWKRIAASIRKRDNYTCQMCGKAFEKTSKILHVHHKDGDKLNNEPDNLVCVCATCHPKGKRSEEWKPRNQPPRQYVISRRGEIFGLNPGEWISTKQASEITGVTQDHVVNLGKQGKFKIERKGGFWYIERASFEVFAATYKPLRH